MRVSIWQQFSSNHSGSVTIVGTFESPEEADQAASKLDGILKEVSAWFEQHEGDHPLPLDAPPLPGEADLLRRLDLPIDRSFEFAQDVRGTLSTTAADRLVLVHIYETRRSPPIQVIRLIGKLGGAQVCNETEIDGAYLRVVNVHLTCTASDAATAEAIAAPIQAYLADPHGYDPFAPLPWEGDEMTDARGTVTQDGSRLVFDLRFFRIKDGLPCFVDFLKSKGCTAISYTLADEFPPDTAWDWG